MRVMRYLDKAFIIKLTSAMALALNVSANSPAVAQPAEITLKICRMFPQEFLRSCGGSKQSTSIKADWFGPEGSNSFANIGILLPGLLPVMQEAQNEYYNSFTLDPAAIGTKEENIVISNCTEERFYSVRMAGRIIYEHGTALCYGYTVNYFVQESLLTGGGVAKFKDAISALGRDIIANP